MMATPEPKRKPDKPHEHIPPFAQTLTTHGLTLLRSITAVLQINIGFLCNQTCRHCHLEASPTRNEMMQPETLRQVAEFAGRTEFEMIDITGGAPEMHPDLTEFISMLAPLTPKITLRSNLTALYEKGAPLMNHLKANGVAIVASFPSLNKAQTESIRGKDCFNISIDALKQLNSMGYGKNGSGLDLDLVVNPAGAFLPPHQAQLEKRFRNMLEQKWGITFNRVFSIANVPLGRFRSWLHQSDNFQKYMDTLVSAFNPCTIEGLMCRTLISVSWDGYLFDCDFNQASGHCLGNRKTHISQMERPPEPGSPISTDTHCYTCTAGSGFT